MSASPRVLVTGAGGPAAVSILRTIGDGAVTFLAGDIDPFAAGLYLVAPQDRVMLPRGDREDFAEVLLAVCERERVDVLIPTVDTELLPVATNRERFAAVGTRLVVASPETLGICLDKWVLHQRCEGAVRVPDTQLVGADFDPAGIDLPAIVKPRRGSGSRGIVLARERDVLQALPRDETLLVQEHLPGAEYSLDVLARADGHVAAVVPRERLKIDSGIAVTGRTRHDDRLDAIARAVAQCIGLTTVANVQVKEAAGGEPALLEVNPRFPGTMPLTVASGVHMPRLALGEALGEAIPDGPQAFDDVAMVRFLDEAFFAPAEIDRLAGMLP
jgi:carbamoyl-phosphate synthase large subunit